MAFDSNENVLVKLESIRLALSTLIGKMIEQQEQIIKLLTPEESSPVTITTDESTGTCPSCESIKVGMGTLHDGKAVFQCLECQLIWTN